MEKTKIKMESTLVKLQKAFSNKRACLNLIKKKYKFSQEDTRTYDYDNNVPENIERITTGYINLYIDGMKAKKRGLLLRLRNKLLTTGSIEEELMY